MLNQSLMMARGCRRATDTCRPNNLANLCRRIIFIVVKTDFFAICKQACIWYNLIVSGGRRTTQVNQEVCIYEGNRFGRWQGQASQPVSYTHLDVYKRQPDTSRQCSRRRDRLLVPQRPHPNRYQPLCINRAYVQAALAERMLRGLHIVRHVLAAVPGRTHATGCGSGLHYQPGHNPVSYTHLWAR